MIEYEEYLHEIDTQSQESSAEQIDLNKFIIEEVVLPDVRMEIGEFDAQLQEVDTYPQELESDKSELIDEDKVSVQKPKITRQPTAEVRLNGIHLPYKASYQKLKCRLTGCKRTTTYCCANENCNMHLCLTPCLTEYFDAGYRQTPPEKIRIIQQTPSENQNCFLVYHCMTKPTALLNRQDAN
jgi:hypothetical protein